MNNMNYDEFRKELLRLIQEKSDNNLSEDVVRIEDACERSLIYMEGLYLQYIEGADLFTCAEFALEICHAKPEGELKEHFSNWNQAKSKIEIRLLNKNWNQEYLDGIPYKEFLDLALYCKLIYEKNENGKIGVAVDESMLLAWGIEEHELWGEAVKNLMNEDFTVCNIDNATGISSAALKSILGVPPLDDKSYVLTNKYHNNGAVGILRTDLLEKFSRRIGCDFYILPSSVNEVVLVPDRVKRNPVDLRRFVAKNNKDYRDGSELSDNVYYYRSAMRKIEIV